MEPLDLIFEKDLYIPLNKIEILSKRGNLIAAGNGRLCKNEEIEIIVDGDIRDFRAQFIMSRNHGLIHEADMHTAHGESDLLKMNAAGVECYKTGKLPNIFKAKNVRLEFTSEPTNYTLTRLTGSPSIIRMHTANSATHFKLRQHWLWSWAKIEVSGKIFSLSSNEGSFLYCEHPVDEDYLKRESALLTALGFVASQYVDISARYEANANSLTLRRAVESTDQWASPIKMAENVDEVELVRLVAEMLFADGTNKLRDIIRHYLTSPGPLFVPVRSLHICILIEALLATLQKNRGWRYGKTLKAKYDKAIGELKLPRDDDEFMLFKQVRDDLAHGKVNDPYSRSDDDAQEEYNRKHVLNNIFNKLMLGAAGYHGAYFDFSRQEILQL
jgi:hypothetical protein